MSEKSDEVKIKIQRTLININDVTKKIKEELRLINEMVKSNGLLTLRVDEANEVLAKIAQSKKIKIPDDLLDPQNGDVDDLELLGAITVDTITQKLMAIMDS